MSLTKAPMNILLVDDDADDQTLFIEAILTLDAAIRCEITGNGEEAIRYLKAAQTLPDIIFLDLNMPVMNGRTCLNIIKATTRFKEIPVIIISTSNNRDEFTPLILMGARYMTKPNSFGALVDELREFISPTVQSTDLLSVPVALQ